MEQIKTPSNLRDLGGIAASGQRWIKPKKLVRCGELFGLTHVGAVKLQERYHIKRVLDFRTSQERKARPDCVIPGTEYQVLDFFPVQADDRISGSEKQMGAMQNTGQVREYMKALYTSFIKEESAVHALNQFIQTLLQNKEGAVLFHCFAGKDRTGIASAVILTILGVPETMIMEDYLLTNRMCKETNKRIMERLGTGKSEKFLEILEKALGVDEEYMMEAYKTAKQLYGSFEDYILYGIGVGEKEQEQLREMYLTFETT